jgi:hypothetical protein
MQIAKVGNIVNGSIVGYTVQALADLNSILDLIAETVDFSAAMRTFNFTMNTNLIYSGEGNIIQAAPNPLPIDYLRVQTAGGSTGAQRSSKWYLQGVPYDMVEIDLTEWDDQVQQAGEQSYPYYWAKDMSQRQILANITGDLNSASQTVANLSSTTGYAAGMSIAGGIGPLSVIVPGTTIESINTGAATMVLSAAPTMTLAGASLIIGNPPVGLPYPPPSGAFATMIRYQAYMPPLTQAQVDDGAYCWFPDDLILIDLLVERMMAYSDDQRMAEFGAYAERKLGKYTKLADDRSNRGQTVQLDRRSFGKSFSTLQNTKKVGWLVFACAVLPMLSIAVGGC